MSAPAAIANAVADAIGVDGLELPLTPPRVWELLAMKPPPFRYLRPETLEEAASLLAEHGDEAKVLAGGQSLVPILNFRLIRPTVLVDVNRVASLSARRTARRSARPSGRRTSRRAARRASAPARRPLTDAQPRNGRRFGRTRGRKRRATALPARPRRHRVAPRGPRDRRRRLLRHALHDDAGGRRAGRSDGLAGRWRRRLRRSSRCGTATTRSPCAPAPPSSDEGAVASARVGVGSVVDRPTLLDLDLDGAVADAGDSPRRGATRGPARRPAGKHARVCRLPEAPDRRWLSSARSRRRSQHDRADGQRRAASRRVRAAAVLSDFIRHELGLTGTHVGCEHGVCGACTVLLDGRSVRSCLTFAIQADGAESSRSKGSSGGTFAGRVPPPSCAPVRLLHARDPHRGNRPPRARNAESSGRGRHARRPRLPCTGYAPIVDAIMDVAS